MRFLVIVKASKDSETGVMPGKEFMEEMFRFNEQLVNAGVRLAAEGVQPSSKGKRIRFEGPKKRTLIDGPFTETKELVAGFWLLQVRNQDEAVEWVKRAPFQEGEVEIRQLFEIEDFADTISPEHREKMLESRGLKR